MKRLIILCMCLFFLVGCENKSAESLGKEKISSEMEYLSSQIQNLLNNLNNISLENYELVSEKITISESSEEKSSGEGSSQPSSGQQGSKSGGGEENSKEGGQQSSQKEQSITTTEMQNNSVLKIDTEDINWDVMRQQIETINTSWSIVMMDLYNNNVSNEDIIGFSNTLDASILAIKNEDKISCLTNLTTLYSYIPKFLEAISAEKHVKSIENTKYHVFTAYSAASQEDWNAVTNNLSNVENSFFSILNDEEYSRRQTI